MKAYIEQRMFTMGDQVAVVKPNDTRNGLMLCISESGSDHTDARLYLDLDEAIELSKTLTEMVNRIKN
jgi:hypothetical protein